jgi:hypothetical protein
MESMVLARPLMARLLIALDIMALDCTDIILYLKCRNLSTILRRHGLTHGWDAPFYNHDDIAWLLPDLVQMARFLQVTGEALAALPHLVAVIDYLMFL